MTRILVVFCFAAAFVAGLIVGLTRTGGAWISPQPPATTRPAPERGRRSDPGSYLAQQLSLTPEQQQQMREIWTDAAGKGGREQGDQRRKMREQRDAAIVALIRPEDQAAYQAILKDYEAKIATMEAQWRSAFQNAVERTKAILTDEQRIKYEAILKQWDERDRDRHRGSAPKPPPTDAPK